MNENFPEPRIFYGPSDEKHTLVPSQINKKTNPYLESQGQAPSARLLPSVPMALPRSHLCSPVVSLHPDPGVGRKALGLGLGDAVLGPTPPPEGYCLSILRHPQLPPLKWGQNWNDTTVAPERTWGGTLQQALATPGSQLRAPPPAQCPQVT